MFSKTARPRDRRYLDSFRGRACEACGVQDDTIVPAHVRTGLNGGMGLRPPDSDVLALCFKCHSDFDQGGGAKWLVKHVLLPILRKRYARWKEKQ